MHSLLMLASCCLAQAGAPEQPEMVRRVAQLVRQLDDDSWSRRENAEQDLLDMGPDILSVLPEKPTGMSPEAATRLARVRMQLQLVRAKKTASPSRVTLQGTMMLDQALRLLQKSTGNALVGYAQYAEREINIDVEQVPFWEALDRILDQTELTVYPYEGHDAALQLIQRDPNHADRFGRADYKSVFRVEPTYVSATRDLLNASIQGLRVRLSVAWEPRARPISLSLPLSSVTARDDRGNPVLVDGPQGQLEAAVESDIPSVDLELPLELPPRRARFIKSLQGTISATIPGEVRTLEFDSLERRREQQERFAEVTVTVKEIRQNDERDEFIVHVEFADAANALESHRGWIFNNQAFVLSSDGTQIDAEGQRLLSQSENSVQISYSFMLDQPLSDCKFVYRTPSLIMRQPVPFTLENIGLP